MGNKITVITADLINQVSEQAKQSERKRVMHVFHQGDWEHMHRMLNALSPGTYIQPHKHDGKYESEGFIVLSGKVAVLIFTNDGKVDLEQSVILESGTKNIGVDIKPGTWHSIVPLKDSVMYEVKGWPNEGYQKEHAKDFASWAPKEGTLGSTEYLKSLFDAINMVH